MSIRKPLPVEAAPAYQPYDFVYTGTRIASDGKHLIAMHLINPNGTLGDRRVYDYKRKYDRTIGAIYTGAMFSPEGQARGINNATFLRMWEGKIDLVRWEALHHAARVILAQQRVEERHGHLISTTVAPLHDVYHALIQRGDDDAVIALELAVVQALRAKDLTI
jgi:hypothetical protein